MSDPTATTPDPDRAAQQIARINELTSVGRANWLGLLAYLAFAAITLLSVEDADFFIDTRQTTLPLIGVAIPTFSFFIFAPILGAALYVYLHLHIRKLAEALAAPPATVDGAPLETHLKSWLLTDLILRRRGDGATTPRRLDWLAEATTLLLVWLAGPYVLFHFWWRSWPAHAEWLSTGLLICALIAVYAGINSWLSMTDAVHGRRGGTDVLTTGLGLCATFLVLGHLTWVKTETGAVRDVTRAKSANAIRFWSSLAPINLTGLAASTLPPDQLDYLDARRQFRIDWCAREGHEMDVCGPFTDWPGEITMAVSRARTAWCAANAADVDEDCAGHFAALDADFRADWASFRAAQIAALSPPDLSSDSGRMVDLRNANLEDALLIGVDFTGSRLDGAFLAGAQLQGARLTSAQMRGADLFGARLQGADLDEAGMERARFSSAEMHRTTFRDALLNGAYLGGAQLQGANFFGAEMRRANFLRAALQGASLIGVDMQEARFTKAQLQQADLLGARMQGAVFEDAQLQGVQLRNANMDDSSFRNAQLHGADLKASSMGRSDFEGATMQGTDLTDARMHGARFEGAQLQGAALGWFNLFDDMSFDGATLHGAALGYLEEAAVARLRPHWDDIMAVLEKLPEGAPSHWQETALRDYDSTAFLDNWRVWAAELEPPVTIAPDWPR